MKRFTDLQIVVDIYTVIFQHLLIQQNQKNPIKSKKIKKYPENHQNPYNPEQRQNAPPAKYP
jgi:hypothetical protein